MEKTKQRIEWPDIFLKMVSTIISGIVIAFVGLLIWEKQNMTIQQQKIFDYKMEMLNKLSSDGGNMIHYSEFMIRTKLELYQLFLNEYDSSFRPEQDSKIYEKTMQNQLIIQKEKPILYAEYMKGLEFQSTFLSTLLMTKTVFEAYPELDTLQYLFSEEAIVNKIIELNKGDLINISTLNKEDVVNSIRNEQMRLLSRILEGLFLQVKYPDKYSKSI